MEFESNGRKSHARVDLRQSLRTNGRISHPREETKRLPAKMGVDHFQGAMFGINSRNTLWWRHSGDMTFMVSDCKLHFTIYLLNA
jgi:hypothetical protein